MMYYTSNFKRTETEFAFGTCCGKYKDMCRYCWNTQS